MSRDMWEQGGVVRQDDLQMQLAVQCAPLLAGVKVSNLLIVGRTCAGEPEELFAPTAIAVCRLCESKRRVIYLLYRQQALERYLSLGGVRELMEEFGYGGMELEEILLEFSARYDSYQNQRAAFPHEIGLLLGYPAEDVKGFIENRGKNSLHTGEWKVYENLDAKLQLFQRYHYAREKVFRMVSGGVDIRHIVGSRYLAV